MKSYPTSGYVVPVEEFISKLSNGAEMSNNYGGLGNIADRLRTMLELESTGEMQEELESIVADELWLAWPFPECTLYRPDTDNGDDPGDLEDDTYYLVFEPSDLFVTTSTPENQSLRNLGIKAEHASWSIFC